MSKTELSLSDEWETPEKLFKWLCGKYAFYPKWDVCATEKNKKCDYYIEKEWTKNRVSSCVGDNGVSKHVNWTDKNWCNPPHSETELWVRKACNEFLEYYHETMMIIPANSMCTTYAESCIEPHAEYHPIFERPKFLMDKEEKDVARNSYFVVIWRKN